MTEEAKDPREEAERLIASVLGSASLAAENLSGFATGSAECCVCPVCRAIAAARQPNPRVAERIASGAGDLAQGLASMLRAFSSGFPAGFPGASRPAPGGGTSTATEEDPWHTATRAAEAEAAGSDPAAPSATAAPAAPATTTAPGAAEPAAPPKPLKPMAKKAVKPKAPPPPEPETAAPEPGEES
jgi:hypothetical protein